ncbi:MAG: TraB/GumN family protein [Bacteroidia bacterium]|jgi:uncharacterized protein YbaP (TraB family)|nr:TraB/GumN family protein [Bacteroidia bacterium]
MLFRTIFRTISLILLLVTIVQAQPLPKGLLWEISGKGMTKPSYLYGTMHVSSKLAFNLSDSFFIALKNVDKVALESTPENWLEEFFATGFMSHLMRVEAEESNQSTQVINPNSFAWFDDNYPKNYVLQALAVDPAILNQLMFRHTSNKQDFEEDTYLDLYIFQLASKLKKPVLSVEDLDESLQLVMRAYSDMYPEDKQRKYIENFDELLEEYYRQADLFQLDSLVKAQGYSSNYMENMLYIRNKNMVHRMDSIMRTGSLFTGVGASHLPGDKGVIALLREMGYQVRAVNLGQRNSSLRKKLDAINVPITYQKFTAPDGLFSVEAPGKLLVMPDNSISQQYLYSDMMNGAFYSVTRIKHFSSFYGYDEADYRKSIDSMLYEYIPGDIVSQKTIDQNGYVAYDITNKNKRGNLQRYRIIFTPIELIIFKTGGKGNYVKEFGEQFFKSIVFNQPPLLTQPYRNTELGFEIALPVMPISNYEKAVLSNYTPGSIIYQAVHNRERYFILTSPFFNTSYIEEDTVELNIAAFGFERKTNLMRNTHQYKNISGYPALFCTYRHKEKGTSMAAVYVIKGASVYVFSVWGDNPQISNEAIQVLNSIKLIEKVAPEAKFQTDTIHRFTLKSSVSLPPDINAYNMSFKKREDKRAHLDLREKIELKEAATGEKVIIKWTRRNKYEYFKDTASLWKSLITNNYFYNTFNKKVTYFKNKNYFGAVVELTDSNSSRCILHKIFISGRFEYQLTAVVDTITKGNNFVKTIFESFEPITTDSFNLFANSGNRFLNDIISDDSTTYAQARELSKDVDLDKTNVNQILETIPKLKDDKHKKGLEQELILALGRTKDPKVLPILKLWYENAGDDYEKQFSILKALARFKTKQSYTLCRDLLIKEPPFLTGNYYYDGLFSELRSNDSLFNSILFFPELFKLTRYDEYRQEVYEMLSWAIDSNKITVAQYQPYLNDLINEAKKQLKKELTNDDKEKYYANYMVESYNNILIHHYDLPQVKEYFDKQLKAKNYVVKLNTVALLLKHKKAVDDTIVFNLSENLTSRTDFFSALKEFKIEDKMPAQFRTRDALVYAEVKDDLTPDYGDDKLDTIVFVAMDTTYFKGIKGIVYFYKYKMENSDDWNTYVTGMYDFDSNTYKLLRYIGAQGEVFNEKGSWQEQFFEMVEQAKQRQRAYGYGSFNFSRNFFEEYPEE